MRILVRQGADVCPRTYGFACEAVWVRAEAAVGGHRAAEGRFVFRLFPPGTIGSGADPELFAAWTRSVSEKLFAETEVAGR